MLKIEFFVHVREWSVWKKESEIISVFISHFIDSSHKCDKGEIIMRFIHTSDLHLGKRLGEYSLYEDQKAMLDWLCDLCREKNADGILIAGDIYDRSNPSAESVALFDGFLSRLSAQGTLAFVINGNHDAPERVSYGGKLFAAQGIYVSEVFDGEVRRVDLTDVYGELHIYLLPFVKPVQVREAYGTEAESYTDALREVVCRLQVDTETRNILVAHQYITGSAHSESEIFMGGLDNVDASVLADFDYTALGHLHRCQRAGGENIRYSGSPLAYSFGEWMDSKGVLLVDVGEKGRTDTAFIPYTPLHILAELEGSYADLTSHAFYEKMDRDVYLRILLTDTTEVPDAMAKLSVIYPRIVRLEYTHFNKIVSEGVIEGEAVSEKISPMDVFASFFEQQNDCVLNEEEMQYLEQLIRGWEGAE